MGVYMKDVLWVLWIVGSTPFVYHAGYHLPFFETRFRREIERQMNPGD